VSIALRLSIITRSTIPVRFRLPPPCCPICVAGQAEQRLKLRPPLLDDAWGSA
jgi:hypothetical protein